MKRNISVKKIVKRTTLTLTLLFLLGVIILSVYIGRIDFVKLNAAALEENSHEILIFDADNNIIETCLNSPISIDQLPPHVVNAFIAIEDKRFYSHHGFDYKRIGGALLKNVRSNSYREGASTISQQLIKNTHLNSDKTIERKIKEARLTIELEKKYSKNEILEKYLNVLYFGSGAYGLETASRKFFNKNAINLNLQEAATLAAMINSPAKYSPISNPEITISRRNLVLKNMYTQNMITEEDLNNAINSPLELNFDVFNAHSTPYITSTIMEAEKLLKVYGVKDLTGYRIYTYYNDADQQLLAATLKDFSVLAKNADNVVPDTSAMLVDNQTLGVLAFYASKNEIINIKRQPGSAIKPILVYAPALQKRVISPATPILDEEINFNGYSPRNYNGGHAGWISTRNAVETSNNIAAVKVLNYTGIDYCKSFAKGLGITFNENDNNFALALGGMNEGVTINELTNAYSCLALGGKTGHHGFIRQIIDSKGNIVYNATSSRYSVMDEETAYLMTDMLVSTVENGTAKLLKNSKYKIAAKTGTVGSPESGNNIDAYCMSYTTEHTLGVWMGNATMEQNVTGGTFATNMAKTIYENLYSEKTPKNFTRPLGIKEVNLDAPILDLEHRIVKSNPLSTQRYRIKELFSDKDLPYEDVFTRPVLKGKLTDDTVTLNFNAKQYATYDIYKSVVSDTNDTTSSGKLIKTIKNKFGEQTVTDVLSNDKTKYDYYIIATFDGVKEKSNKLRFINISKAA